MPAGIHCGHHIQLDAAMIYDDENQSIEWE